MLDRYDPRDDGPQDARDEGRAVDRGGRGGGDAPDRQDRDPRDVFTRDLNLPRGRDREPVRDRDRVYDIDGSEARMLATVGSFRVVAEHDLAALRDGGRKAQRSIRHLEDEALIRRAPLDANDRAVVLTDRGRDLLEANRSAPRGERTHEPRRTFYAGLRKPRELTHDVKVYRAYERAEERIRERGGRVRRVVLDYELKRDYQQFLHERNRGRGDCDGRPDREPEESNGGHASMTFRTTTDTCASPTRGSSTRMRTAGGCTRTSRWSPSTTAACTRVPPPGRASPATAPAAARLAGAARVDGWQDPGLPRSSYDATGGARPLDD